MLKNSFWGWSIVALSLLVSACGGAASDEASSAESAEVVATDEYLEVVNHPDDRVLEFVIGPFDMAADAGHLRLPIQKLEMPFDVYGYGFEWSIRSADGEKLPDDLLHHMNIIDIDSRELFSPVARRVIASGRETSSVEIPEIAGIPVDGGNRLWIVSMFGNPTGQDFEDAYLHVNLKYNLPEDGILPTMEVYTFYIDAAGFVGPKDFPVPPGRSEKAFVAQAGADGKILGIGGHLHDFATELRLEDAESGEVLWTGTPIVNEDGRTTGVSRDLLIDQLGIDVEGGKEYRVVVVHENPTDSHAPDGGMGAIGGIMTVTGDGGWPELDANHPDYVEDLENTLLEPERMAAHGHGGHGGHGAHGGDHEGHDMSEHDDMSGHEGHDMSGEEEPSEGGN